MEKNLFAQLLESVNEADEIIRGKKKASRQFEVNADSVKEIRNATGLSQANFAKIIDVPITTIQNWEQGRRVPTGPARVLLGAIRRDPATMMAALTVDKLSAVKTMTRAKGVGVSIAAKRATARRRRQA